VGGLLIVIAVLVGLPAFPVKETVHGTLELEVAEVSVSK
jgi:hypothetical protein